MIKNIFQNIDEGKHDSPMKLKGNSPPSLPLSPPPLSRSLPRSTPRLTPPPLPRSLPPGMDDCPPAQQCMPPPENDTDPVMIIDQTQLACDDDSCSYTSLVLHSMILIINLIYIIYFNTRKDIEYKHNLVINIHLVTLTVIVGLVLLANYTSPVLCRRNRSNIIAMLITCIFLLMFYGILYDPCDEYFKDKDGSIVYYEKHRGAIISCCLLNVALLTLILREDIILYICGF